MRAHIDDIEQDARLRLWRAIESERDLSGLASYIYRIAETATIDAVRRAMARHELYQEEEQGESGYGLLATDPSRAPDLEAERSILLGKVRAALARLPEKRRAAVELYLEGMTAQEVADLLRWTEPKARNLIYRGLEELRRRLRIEGIDYR
jgi:RNA polymerase sigma-70 factor (ECF subfamily)